MRVELHETEKSGMWCSLIQLVNIMQEMQVFFNIQAEIWPKYKNIVRTWPASAV